MRWAPEGGSANAGGSIMMAVQERFHGPGSSRPVSMEGVSVLCVEDHEDSLDALVLILQGHGCRVKGVTTVREGLESLGQGPYDALIVDYCLPDGEGTTVIREAEQRGVIRASHAILFTAHPEPRGASGIEIMRKPLSYER